MYKDKLTSSERMNALINKNKLDRIPFISSATMYAGRLAGLSSQEFFLNPQASFDAQILCGELHNCDGAPGFDLPGWIGWDFGGELSIADGNKISIPKFNKRAVENASDVEKLEMPDLDKAYAFQKRIEFYKISRQHNLSASIPAGSPLEIVGQIVEPTILIRWFHKEPYLVHSLLRTATDYILKTADYYIEEFGVENCSAFSCYPLESNTMISHKMFKKFSLPYILEIHEKLLEKGVKSFGIHLCGDHKYNLQYFKEIPLPERSLVTVSEKNDIEHTAKAFGDKYIIGGNVATTLLKTGTPKEVFNASKGVIEKIKYHKGGAILMPSCDLPPGTPPLNLYAMLKAAKTFGKY